MEFKLACLLLNIKQAVTFFGIATTDMHREWFQNDFEFPTVLLSTNAVERAAAAQHTINQMSIAQDNAITELFNEQFEDYETPGSFSDDESFLFMSPSSNEAELHQTQNIESMEIANSNIMCNLVNVASDEEQPDIDLTMPEANSQISVSASQTTTMVQNIQTIASPLSKIQCRQAKILALPKRNPSNRQRKVVKPFSPISHVAKKRRK